MRRKDTEFQVNTCVLKYLLKLCSTIARTVEIKVLLSDLTEDYKLHLLFCATLNSRQGVVTYIKIGK